MHKTWRNRSDFMEDIWALSEMEGVKRYEVEVEETPEAILEYRAQMAANNTGSIYDNPEQDEEGVTYIMSGRGRGGISTILRPGISELSDSQVAEEVQRKLRQVSGLGYSNALIEQGVRAMTIAHDKTNDSPKSARQNSPLLVTARQNSPQLVSATKTPSPRKTAHNTSGLCSPPIDKDMSSSSSSSLNSSSPCPPPPLSVMMKRAREEKKKEKNEKQKTPEPEKKPVASMSNGKTGGSPRSPQNRNVCAWRDRSGSSSDEGSWRIRNGNSSNAFFRKPANFYLNREDFPALK